MLLLLLKFDYGKQGIGQEHRQLDVIICKVRYKHIATVFVAKKSAN